MKTFGCMDVYIADEKQPFGSGKTLNMIRNAFAIYNQFNDTAVYNFSSGEWVKQYVHVFSNIELRGIPYVPLVNTYQLIQVAPRRSEFKLVFQSRLLKIRPSSSITKT